ncbi:MAG: hypothetical protein ACE5G2_01210 [Candidatus Krumholzibacteriia bacterium]
MELQRFVESTLRRAGCLTEILDRDRVEALLSPPVAGTLELPEDVRLRLRGPTQAGELHAGYGSGLLARVCSLAETGSRCYRLELAPAPPKRTRVEREVAAILSLQNAIGRSEGLEVCVLEYLVFDFRYAALSEERHEGLISVALNADGGCSPALAQGVRAHLFEHPETHRPWSGENGRPEALAYYERARLRARIRALDETRPFAARMERRLQRDTRRVDAYYQALLQEVERGRTRRREAPEVLNDKLAAIEAEKQRRRQDLQRRYSIALRLELLDVLVLRVLGLALRVRLQRRKSVKHVRVGWNAIARQFDRWMCDACGSETAVPAICDDFHVLCAECPPQCPACGRPACFACRPRRCRCGRSPASLDGARSYRTASRMEPEVRSESP